MMTLLLLLLIMVPPSAILLIAGIWTVRKRYGDARTLLGLVGLGLGVLLVAYTIVAILSVATSFTAEIG